MDGASVTFERRASGRLVIKLGAVEVGEVSPWAFPGALAGAYWSVMLPGLIRAPRSARGMDEAKAAAERAVLAWVDAAGLAFAAVTEQPIRAQRAEVRA